MIFGFPQKINSIFEWSQIGPMTKAILEKYSINPITHTVFSGVLQYNEIEDNYPLTLQELIDINHEQLNFLYKLQEGEKEMQSIVDNLADNAYFKYHIMLHNIPIYFEDLSKKRKKDIESIKQRIFELEELQWEDEEFINNLSKQIRSFIL